MPNFKATSICSEGLQNSGYTGIISHNRGDKELIVNDTLISDQVVANARAKAELIKGAYMEKWVAIQTTFIPNLRQNDIFSFKGVNYIVKELSLDYQPPKLIQNIKGLRYE